MSIWFTISGVGVRTAAITKFIKIAYFLFLLRKATSTMPILARKTISIGSSKMTPKAINKRMDNEKYSLIAGIGLRKSAEYPNKNRKAGGKTTK